MSKLTTTEKQYVKDVYENIANRFDSTRLYTWSWIEEFLEKLPSTSLVYDIGCGNGRNMMNNKIKFIGIDNCENFINICKSKNLEVINSNITNIPLDNNRCDAIICIALFHKLSNIDNNNKFSYDDMSNTFFISQIITI